MILKTINWVRKWIGKSVFVPLPKESSMESILVAMFHRASATLYLIYTLWAVFSIAFGIPSLIEAQGEQWQVIFSMCVLLFAAPACFGATFWPSFARLELFAGLGFSCLIAIYIFYLLGNALFRDGPIAGVIIVSSVIVIPLCRVIIVIIFLVRQADDRKKRLAALGENLFPMPKEA